MSRNLLSQYKLSVKKQHKLSKSDINFPNHKDNTDESDDEFLFDNDSNESDTDNEFDELNNTYEYEYELLQSYKMWYYCCW